MMRFRGLIPVLTAVLVAVLLLAACAPGPAATPTPKPEEAKKVRVALSLTMTGPLASTGRLFSTGVWDYLRYVNDVLGGIEYRAPDGKLKRVKMDIIWEDTAYDMARAVATYKRQREFDPHIMHISAGSPVLTVLSFITKDHMPVVYYGPAQPNAMAERPLYTVAEFGTYTDEEAVFMDWVKANWKEARPPRVGFIQLDTAMARAELPGKVPDYAKSIGVEWVGTEWLPYAVTESTVELKRLAEKGADWIFVCHVAGGGAPVVLKDAVRLGLKDKIKFAIVHWGFDETFPKVAGEAAEGVYGMLTSALPSEDIPGVRLAREIAARYRPGFEPTIVYLAGIPIGMVMVEGVKRALEKVGYDNLTREAVMEGLLSIKDLDVGGILPNITLDPEYPVMNPRYRLGVVEGGKIKPVSDWFEMHYLLKGWKPGG